MQVRSHLLYNCIQHANCVCAQYVAIRMVRAHPCSSSSDAVGRAARSKNICAHMRTHMRERHRTPRRNIQHHDHQQQQHHHHHTPADWLVSACECVAIRISHINGVVQPLLVGVCVCVVLLAIMICGLARYVDGLPYNTHASVDK